MRRPAHDPESVKRSESRRDAFKRNPHCCLRGTGTSLTRSSLLLREDSMRWKVSPHGHDPRQVDLLAIAALLVVVASAMFYFDRSPEPASTTALIVPSQSVRW
jgi:hypothetical protein